MIANRLALLFVLQTTAATPASPRTDYSKYTQAELCAVLTKEASEESDRLDAETRLSASVDCAKRNLTYLITSTSGDPKTVQKLAQLGPSFEREMCDDRTRQVQMRGYVISLVFNMPKLGKKTTKVVKC